MSIFEIGMLVCFGASWPFSVYKTWKLKTGEGKSFVFLWLVIIGYICGVIHKLYYSHRDWVVWLYVLNTVLVATDLVLCMIYQRRCRLRAAAQAVTVK